MSENNKLRLVDFDVNISKLRENLEYLEGISTQAIVTAEVQRYVDSTVWLFEKILEQAEKLMRIVLLAHGVPKSSVTGMTFKRAFGTAVKMEFIDEEMLAVLSDFWELRNDSTHDYLSEKVGSIIATAASLIPVAKKLNVLFSSQVPIE